MSEFKVKVVRINNMEKHPRADNLSIVRIQDYPVVIRTEDFRIGDKAVYIPVDAVVPSDDPQFSFLDGHNRIKARKFRGVFSMGLLIPAKEEWKEGEDVREQLRITKYEPPEPFSSDDVEEATGLYIPKYTDMEGLRAYPNILQEGENVAITEKIHGANARFVWINNRLWVGSHKQMKKVNVNNIWGRIALQEKLDDILKNYPDMMLFGEIYGWVQSLHYGLSKGQYAIAFFDVMDRINGKYLSWSEVKAFLEEIHKPLVPIIYEGKWCKELKSLAEGKSLICSNQIREGIVIRPVIERWNDEIGRVILKLKGEEYLVSIGE